MAIAFVRANNATPAAVAASRTVTLDAATANGNLLLAAQGIAKGTQITLSPPAAFTDVADEAAGANSTDTFDHAGYKIASSDGGVAYTWGISPQAAITATVVEYSGVDTTTPVDTPTASISKDHDVTTVAAITTSVANCKLVLVLVLSGAATLNTDPTGFTRRVELVTSGGSGTNPRLLVLDKDQAAAGSSGSVSLDVSTGLNDTVLFFALRPASTSGGSASVSESVPVSAAFTRAQSAQSRPVSFTAAVAAVFARAASKARSLADTVSIGVAIARAQGSQARTMADSVAVSAAFARSTSQQRTGPESVPVVVSFAGSSATGGAITASLPISTGVARSYAGARSIGATVGTLVAFSGVQSAQSRDAAASVPISTGASAVFISVNALRIRAVQAGTPMTRSAAGPARTRATAGAPMTRVAAGPVTTSR